MPGTYDDDDTKPARRPRPRPRNSAQAGPRQPAAREPAQRKSAPPRKPKRNFRMSDRFPSLAKRKKLKTFAELGWTAGSDPEEGEAVPGSEALAVDVGVEALCVTSFNQRFEKAEDKAHPTMALVRDPHAFRSLEPFSLDYGLPAWERWPGERVLRGTHGALLLPSQIGLVEFPSDHVIAGIVRKVRAERERSERDLVITLPTFLPSDRSQAIREAIAPSRRGGFLGLPAAIAAAVFYLSPALAEERAGGSPSGEDSTQIPELLRWSREALGSGRTLILDWGASGLHYGLVSARALGRKTALRLALAGTWPSLGGHRLTLRLAMDLKALLVHALLEAGPSDELVHRALLTPGSQAVPRPPGYDDAFRRLMVLGRPSNGEERRERAQLRNLLFPTRWTFPPGEEPPGYAPYRRLAVRHFKALWEAAEQLKRLLLSDPPRYRKRGSISWDVSNLDSPFLSHLGGSLEYPAEGFLDPVARSLQACLRHVDRRLTQRRTPRPLHVATTGMQGSSPLLREALDGLSAHPRSRALAKLWACPTSSHALESKAVVNRGAALARADRQREEPQLDIAATPPEVLPYSVQIADCLGNVTVFAAGPLDELAVFQRRIKVEGGFPRFEFFLYASEDGSQRGSWGCIDFAKPYEFTPEDRSIAVDPRYGFGKSLPTLRALRGDAGRGLTKCHDRSRPGQLDGSISFRAYAPRGSEPARRLLHFLEHGLRGAFHSKVFLLEREFQKPPKRADAIYQRYYLSRSQELMVVREWWAPVEGNKLMRHKTLHTCQGSTEANTILGLAWGSY